MSTKGLWNDNWLDIQKEYWENWTELSRKAMGLPEPPKNPWERAMDHWWEAVSPAAPDLAKEFMEKMLDQGKTFFRMADEFAKNWQVSGAPGDWSEVLNKTFADMQKGFAAATRGAGDDALHKMMAFWEMPLDNWQRMVSSLSLVPGDMLRNMPHSPDFERYLSAPGLGYTREEQGQQQEMMRLFLDYQKELQAYMEFFSNLGIQSVDRMRTKLAEFSEQGSKVESARALYDLWVESCEEVYGEQVMSAEYAQLHGRLINALMALKRHLGEILDEALGAMNMPTRAELRTLQDRQQELRRENRRLRSDLEGLRDKVERLAKPTAVSASPSAPKKKAAPRRKTVPRKTSE